MDAPAQNVAEYTVSELAFSLRRTVEDAYEHVRVRGEVSGYKGAAGSGHCYFTLKDDRACLEAVVWKTTFSRLRFRPSDGLEMVATGKLTTFPGRSKYQIVIEHLEPAGAGALMALLEERKKQLAAEGLFDEAKKRPIPFLPRTIGVVTSPTGAVIRDILHRLRDRFPTHVLVWPVRVQGDGAADEVAAAIEGFNALALDGALPRPDLLIVGRGGGSIEDLWAFNEEVVVRAAAASRIPLISAVGHETDWTLLDLAADWRAPTPTAAAERAVPVRSDLMAQTADLAGRHHLAWQRSFEGRWRDLRSLMRSMPGLSDLLALPRQRLDSAGGRLAHGLRISVATHRRELALSMRRLEPDLLARACGRARERLALASTRAARSSTALTERRCSRFAQAARLLDTLSHKAVLKRGFALVRSAKGAPVRFAAAVAPGERLEVEFADGRVGVEAEGAAARPPRKRARRSPDPAIGQQSLF
jgi:exodeoxyribonuclease VII large subunit